MRKKLLSLVLTSLLCIQIAVAETTKKGTIDKNNLELSELTINGTIYKIAIGKTKVTLKDRQINLDDLIPGLRVEYKIEHHIITEIEVLASNPFIERLSNE